MRIFQSRIIKNPARRITPIADGILNCKCVCEESSLPRPPSRSLITSCRAGEELLPYPPSSPSITSCRAVLLPHFGGPEMLELRHNLKVPDLKHYEVLVRTRAVSINPIDIAMRSGYGGKLLMPSVPFQPLILGRDISGEVAAVGASVRSLSVGQEVFGASHPTESRGTYTDYAVLSEFDLTQKPKSITHEEASAIPFAALTAWRALKRTARISEGQRLLVIGGGGAVGFAAIQLAVANGCQVVTTCGRQSIYRALAAGAEQAVDYTDINLAIKGEFDVVLDTIGGGLKTESTGIEFLKRGGLYMTLQGDARSMVLNISGVRGTSLVFRQKRSFYNRYNEIEYLYTFMEPDIRALREIRTLCEAGKFHIPVDKTFPITQVREAHEAKEKRQIVGKVVLQFD